MCKNCSLSLWHVPEIKIQDKNHVPAAYSVLIRKYLYAILRVAKGFHCYNISTLEMLTMKEGEHSGLIIKWYYLLKENSIYLPTPSPKPSAHDTVLYLVR